MWISWKSRGFGVLTLFLVRGVWQYKNFNVVTIFLFLQLHLRLKIVAIQLHKKTSLSHNFKGGRFRINAKFLVFEKLLNLKYFIFRFYFEIFSYISSSSIPWRVEPTFQHSPDNRAGRSSSPSPSSTSAPLSPPSTSRWSRRFRRAESADV